MEGVEDVQVVIPDLEEDDGPFQGLDIPLSHGFHSPSGSQAEPAWPGSSDEPLLLGPVSGAGGAPATAPSKSRAGRLRHFRSGSLSTDEVASISTKSSFRFGSSLTNAFSGIDYFQTPNRNSDRSDGLHNFSFPVKKSSFASLRAAIKGQSSAPSTKDSSDLISSPNGPLLDADAQSLGSKRMGRSFPLASDISAVSSGLANVTGMQRPSRWHFKSNSQASTSQDSGSILMSHSPSRVMCAKHAHCGSQLSENSVDGVLASPSEGSVVAAGNDGLSSPVGLGPMDDVDPLSRLSPICDIPPTVSPVAFAMRQILHRFQALADDALHLVLTTPLDCDALLIMFPSAAHHAAWDDVWNSLASMAQHDRQLTTNSLLAWRLDALDQPLMLRPARRRPSDTLSVSSSSSNSHAGDLLRRRRALAATYLTCRALLGTIPPGTNDRMGADLDDDDPAVDEFVTTVFQFLHLCSIDRESERGAQAKLHVSLQQQCFDMVARLIGELSRQCLPALGDQFVSILHQSSAVAVSRDNELLTEAAVLGMRYLRITIYPMDVFEAGAQFVGILARFFAHSHGYRIKRAFARVLHTIIEPVARTASAELHHPAWVQAMSTLMPKAQAMACRSRYCSVAFPLWTAALCASPPDVLLERWYACIEAGWSRLKERPKDAELRLIIYTCASQLFWAYLFRCHEGTNPTHRRLDAFFHLCLPAVRSSVSPLDVCMEPCVDILSAALLRQFEYTHSIVLDLLRHTQQLDRKSGSATALVVGSSSSSTSSSSATAAAAAAANNFFQPDVLQPTRMCMAIRAIALSLHVYVSGEASALPGGERPSIEDLASEPLKTIPYPSADVERAYTQFFSVSTQIALHCDYLVKDLTVLDDQVPLARGTNVPILHGERALQDAENYEVRTHANGAFTVAYAREHQPHLELLRTCIETWPRCMSSTASKSTCQALLFRGLFSVEPSVQRASAAALMRFARGQDGAQVILRAFLQWFFRKDGVVWELQSHADVLVSQFAHVTDLVADLLALFLSQSEDALAHDTFREFTAGALLFLCLPSAALRRHVIELLLQASLSSVSTATPAAESRATAKFPDTAPPPDAPAVLTCGELFARPCTCFLHEDHPELSASQRARIAKWRSTGDAYPLSRLASSGEHCSLWRIALPNVLREIVSTAPRLAMQLYHLLLGAVQCLEPSIATIAHLRKSAARVPPTLTFVRSTWRMYILTLCTVGIQSTKHVALLVPYLGCEDADLQDAAADALSHVHEHAYSSLVTALAPLFDNPLWPVRLSIGRILASTASMLPCPSVEPILLSWLHQTLHLLQLDLAPDVHVYQLRRFFCVLLASFYQSLGVESSPHAFPLELRMRLLVVLHDWHSLQDASRLAAQLSAAVERSAAGPKDKVIVSLRHELHLLARHAELAMAALCAGPIDDTPSMHGPTILGWLCDMLAAPSASSRETAQRGLHALLEHNLTHVPLLRALVTQCYRDLAHTQASRTVFLVLVDAWLKLQPLESQTHLAEAQIMCVALCMLAHRDVQIRVGALRILEAYAECQHVSVSFASMAPCVRSSQAASYLEAQRWISYHLSLGHVSSSTSACVLAELTQHMEHIPQAFHQQVLSLLPAWLSAIQFEPESIEHVHLVSLTHMFGVTHPLAVRALWQAVDITPSGARMLLHFLQSRALYYRSVEFIELARMIISSLASSAAQSLQYALYETLSPHAMIPFVPEPATMLPFSLDAWLPPPGTDLMPLPRALTTLLFLSECVSATLLRREHLPVVLHALCMYTDGLPPSLHTSVVRAAEQILCVLATQGLDSAAPPPAYLRAMHAAFSMKRADHVALDDMQVPKKMTALVDALAKLAAPHVPAIRDLWSEVALQWSTNAPNRRMACRSLQIMRALRPTYPALTVPNLVARLADTLALSDAIPYTLEALNTLEAVLATATADVLPPIYWTVVACAGTALEPVFSASLSLLHTWFDQVDMDAETCDALWTSRPASWDLDAPSLQCMVVRGLRIARTDTTVLHLLVRLAHVPRCELIDSSPEDRVLTLLTAALPWCMQTCDAGKSPAYGTVVTQLADALTLLANESQRSDIARITTSIARARFRRADDLVRQAATSLALGCTKPRAVHIVSMLVLTLYHESLDVCRATLLALVPCLQALHAQGSISTLMPDVPLEPLVRLLRTPLASLALDVLHSPLLVDEAPRSMLQACGWAGPLASLDTKYACTNIRAVSRAWEAPETERGLAFMLDEGDLPETELNALTSQLDDLASFFVQDSTDIAPPDPPSPQSFQVAQILSRSTYSQRDSFSPVPPIPPVPPANLTTPPAAAAWDDASWDMTSRHRSLGSDASRVFTPSTSATSRVPSSPSTPPIGMGVDSVPDAGEPLFSSTTDTMSSVRMQDHIYEYGHNSEDEQTPSS